MEKLLERIEFINEQITNRNVRLMKEREEAHSEEEKKRIESDILVNNIRFETYCQVCLDIKDCMQESY